MYDTVVQILRGARYGWSVIEAPEPDKTNEALATRTPEQVAEALDAYVIEEAAKIVLPEGAPESPYIVLRRRLFTENCEMWGTKTAVALGLIHELPVDTIGPAQSPSQWWEWQDRGRNRLGELLCDADEFARRNAYASPVPYEWRAPGMDPLIYQLAVREGYLPVGMTKFDPAYLQSNPKLAEVHGLTAMQWLQNLQARDAGKPTPWLPGGAARSKP